MCLVILSLADKTEPRTEICSKLHKLRLEGELPQNDFRL